MENVIGKPLLELNQSVLISADLKDVQLAIVEGVMIDENNKYYYKFRVMRKNDSISHSISHYTEYPEYEMENHIFPTLEDFNLAVCSKYNKIMTNLINEGVNIWKP